MVVPAQNTPPVVALEFKDFRTFLNAFSANLSQDGMFLEVAEPQTPGSEIDFEFALEGGDALLSGRGEVAWVTDDDEAEAVGMGVRFLDLDLGSAKLIERIEEIRTKSGREVFDIERGTRPAPQSSGSDTTKDLLRAEIESLKEAQLEERASLVADLDTVRLERDRLAERLHALDDSDAGDENEGLRSELDTVRAELQSARGKAAQLELRVEKQDADLARFAEQGKHAMIERDRLETGKKKLAEELEAVRSEVERSEVERQESSESVAQREEMKSSLAEARASEAALREQLTEARSEVEQVEQEARTAESQLRSEIEELEASRDDLRSGLELGQAELDEVRRQFEESAGKNLELEHRTSSLDTQFAEARARLDELESEGASAEAEMTRLRTRHDEMESELDAQRKDAKRARKVSQRVRAVHARLQQELGGVQATLEEIQEATAEAAEDDVVATLESTPEERALEDSEQEESPTAPEAGEAMLAEDGDDPHVEVDTAEDDMEAAESDQEVGPWAEENSRKSKGSGLWATIANKIMGEDEAGGSEGDELDAANAVEEPQPEASSEDGKAVLGGS